MSEAAIDRQATAEAAESAEGKSYSRIVWGQFKKNTPALWSL